ncbi:ABC-three component system protein [Paenibacillus ehimensis]|uniref:ABC-three component system protein n=1 Tax=Paenibacillus ehimensis TaxID=79264 RepID=UPI00046F1A1B|nr:ABC-three component system protein [Paenibacillus ehimensis]
MATNDNTLKSLGLIYQAYIGLIKSLEMNPNDKIIMEHLGDVTLISLSHSSQQVEVKHHLEETTLSDRSQEIWNTVWNWYNNYDEYVDIDRMILFTTAKISQKSILRSWETMDIDSRYHVFKAIGEAQKKNEKGFRSTYNKIFSSNHNPQKLRSVLGRFEVLSEQQTIKSILNKYYKTTFKFLGDEKRMEEFVSSLIGVLLTLPIRQNQWEISYDDFNELFNNFARRFSDKFETPLQLSFEDYEPTISEKQFLSKKRFVSEIKRIDMPDEITDAINDYCRANKTIISFFESNIVRSKDLKDYRKELQKTLSFNKKIAKLKSDSKKILVASKTLYLESMAMEARPINGIINNRDFFQRGVIHSIVDDKELTWYIGDDK